MNDCNMADCSWLIQNPSVADEVEYFYVKEFHSRSQRGDLGTMGDYARLWLGVFHGYAEDKYPHLAECPACAQRLVDQVKALDVKQWVKDRLVLP